MKHQTKTAKGFTVLELMSVVAILGIVTALAAPSYARYIRQAEVTKMARGFESALTVAAINARTSGRTVKICATDDINGSNPECLSNFTSFQGGGTSTDLGWMVFWDINDDDKVSDADSAAKTPKEKIYKRIPFKSQKLAMKSTLNKPILTIMPRNVTGNASTTCIYAPHGSYTAPSTNCDSSTDNLDSDVHEIKIRLSSLGKITFIK